MRNRAVKIPAVVVVRNEAMKNPAVGVVRNRAVKNPAVGVVRNEAGKISCCVYEKSMFVVEYWQKKTGAAVRKLANPQQL